MANPTQKHGKSRSRKRRANWKISAPAVSVCPQCKAIKLPHTVCGACGFYKGKEVLTIAE